MLTCKDRVLCINTGKWGSDISIIKTELKYQQRKTYKIVLSLFIQLNQIAFVEYVPQN